MTGICTFCQSRQECRRGPSGTYLYQHVIPGTTQICEGTHTQPMDVDASQARDEDAFKDLDFED